MSPRLDPRILLLPCALLTACGEEAVPPAQPPRAPAVLSPAAAGPNEALLGGLRAGASSSLMDTARLIADRSDDPTRAAASSLLVGRARYTTSPAFREAARPLLTGANEQARLAPTAQQLEAQIDAYRNEELLRILGAMEPLGGREIVAYCLALGEDELAPLALRKAALQVLVRHADRGDELVRARSQAIWERVAALDAVKVRGAVGQVAVGGATANGANVTDASSVVAGMGKGFRRCYNKGLAEDVNMKGTIRVTAKIGPDGSVVSTSETHVALSPTVITCVVARVAEARFAPPDGGGATVVIPVTFVSR